MPIRHFVRLMPLFVLLLAHCGAPASTSTLPTTIPRSPTETNTPARPPTATPSQTSTPTVTATDTPAPTATFTPEPTPPPGYIRLPHETKAVLQTGGKPYELTLPQGSQVKVERDKKGNPIYADGKCQTLLLGNGGLKPWVDCGVIQVPTPAPTPTIRASARTARIRINNPTTTTLNIRLSGAMELEQAITAEQQDIKVVPGEYEMKVSAMCGSETTTFSIANGERAEFTYKCVYR